MPIRRVIFHLDMDAFYASIEQRDHPALRGQPVIVGAPANQRGVVCAASYEARKFGVHSAMPSATAGRLCPKGVFVRPRMEHYQAESRHLMRLLAESGAVIEQMSIDEAYLDVSATVAEAVSDPIGAGAGADVAAFGSDGKPVLPVATDEALYRALPLARQMKQRISVERQLTATIGIAANKLLAKIASDFRKPDGLTLIPEQDKVRFLRPLPVRALYGVGKVTEQVLHQAGIRTVGEVQDYAGDLRALIGSFGSTLKQFAVGEDDRPLELGDEVKSISNEETFLRDTEDRKDLRACLRLQATELAAKLQRKRLAAHTVQVKVRYSDFTTLTRQITVEEPLAEAAVIYRLACFLLARDKLVTRPLRLLGLGVSNLSEPQSRQLMLF